MTLDNLINHYGNAGALADVILARMPEDHRPSRRSLHARINGPWKRGAKPSNQYRAILAELEEEIEREGRREVTGGAP